MFNITFCYLITSLYYLINRPDELSTNLSILKDGLTNRELKIEAEIEQMLHQCSKTHWEGIELTRYRQDPQQFADYLLKGPKKS